MHAGDVHDALQLALAALAPYRWSPTFAFIDPDGVEARWELLEALAAHKVHSQTKVELFLLLISPQIVRVVNDSLDQHDLQHAEQQVTDLFGSTEWRPILNGRRLGALDAERTRDELTNLMRWRLEKTLGYRFTHTLRLTNVNGAPLYDMIFATDHQIGDKIMRSVYRKAADRFPKMRQEARARRWDRKEQRPALTFSSRTRSWSKTRRCALMSPTNTPRRFSLTATSARNRASHSRRGRAAPCVEPSSPARARKNSCQAL